MTHAVEKVKEKQETLAAYVRALETNHWPDGRRVSYAEHLVLSRAIVTLQGQMATILGGMPW